MKRIKVTVQCLLTPVLLRRSSSRCGCVSSAETLENKPHPPPPPPRCWCLYRSTDSTVPVNAVLLTLSFSLFSSSDSLSPSLSYPGVPLRLHAAYVIRGWPTGAVREGESCPTSGAYLTIWGAKTRHWCPQDNLTGVPRSAPLKQPLGCLTDVSESFNLQLVSVHHTVYPGCLQMSLFRYRIALAFRG